MDAVVAHVEAAFADAPRPTDDALLHPDCFDDGDLQRLKDFQHWSEVPDEVVISEYAALSFLSPQGFRHFIPAYMCWVLRHPDAPEAVVDSCVWAFLPQLHPPPVAASVRSKWALLDVQQRAAITAFLEAMRPHHEDAAAALKAFRQ